MIRRVTRVLRQPWETAESRATLLLQIAVVIGAGVLFTLAYDLQYEIRIFLLQAGLQPIAAGWDGLAWFVWPLAGPAVLLLVRRFPVTRGGMRHNAPWLALGSLVIYLVLINVRYLLLTVPNLWAHGWRDPVFDWRVYWATNLSSVPMDLVTCGGFVAVSVALDTYYKHRDRVRDMAQLQVRAARLESELARAELAALRAQLQPHFLFNTFNAISTLVRQQRTTDAVEMISRLGGLLRLAIERTGRPEVALSEELDFVQRYLEIERVRFGEKLRIEQDIEPGAKPALIPNLLLQPLVENAIKHGISLRAAPGTLYISAHMKDRQLELVVENDGGEPAAPAVVPASGIGLSNTKRRLERLYGAGASLEFTARADGGARVRIVLPGRMA